MANHSDENRNDMTATPTGTGSGIFSILWRRKALVFFGLTVGLVAGLLFYLQKPPTFQSQARLVVWKKRHEALPMQSANGSVERYVEDYVSTQEELIKSQIIWARAADKLKNQKLSMAPSYEEMIGFIGNGLKVSRNKDGSSGATNNVLTIAFSGPAPEDCKLIVNAVIDGYKEELLKEVTGMTDDQFNLLIKTHDRAKEQLAESYKKWGALHERIRDTNFMTLSDLRSRIAQNQGEIARMEGQRHILGTRATLIQKAIINGGDRVALMLFLGIYKPGGNAVPELPKTYEENVFVYQMQIDELLEKVGPGHPEVMALEKRKKNVEAFLAKRDKRTPNSGPSSEPLEVYLEVIKTELSANDATIKYLQDIINQDRIAVQSLEAFAVDEKVLTSERERLAKNFDNLQDRKFALDASREAQLFSASVITPAAAGGKISPILVTTLALSGFLGLVLGGFMSYLAEISDKSFRSIEEVRQRLGFPVIGQVPPLPPFEPSVIEQNPLDPMLVVHHSPKSIHSEAYRGVRTSIYFSTRGKGHQVIQVTSPNPGDGKSTLTANLATSIAQSGRKVILIDADFRKPRVHKIFGLGNAEVGLASVIAGEAQLESAIYSCEVPGLSILPCGPRPANPADLLTSALFGEILEEIKKDYDFVLIDTPPLLAVSDPSVVVPRVDGVILTIRMVKNSRPMAEQASERLSILGANVLGVVVNGMDEGRSGYGYGYGYGYSYGYNYAYAYGDESESSTDLAKKSR